MTEGPSVDLTNCDREPIHIPGSIQNHGCLLVYDFAIESIIQSSQNAAEFLRFDDGPINGKKLSDVFGADGAHVLRNLLARSAGPRRPGLMPQFEWREGAPPCSVAIHAYNGGALLEFEVVEADAASAPLEIARAIVSRLQDVEAMNDLIAITPRLMRAHFGYDRVMIYQFAEDGSGKVISEAKRADLESFLGQHFPASDIPNQARRLYIQNTIRVIADVDSPLVPILPTTNAAGQPLDLSYSHLRSVSPIHLEYLRNMGVGASMSISLMGDGQLWGLVTCHHYGAKALTMAQRISAEMLGEVFSLKLETFRHREELSGARAARKALYGMLSDLASQDDIFAHLNGNLAAFSKMLSCDGIGLLTQDVWATFEGAPPRAVAQQIAQAVGAIARGQIWASERVCAFAPSARAHLDVAAGALLIPLSQAPRDFLMFFRKEQIQTVNWAGDPNKEYKAGPQGDRLTPRKSFAIWKEEVHERSLSWSQEERAIAETIRIQFLEILLSRNESLDNERRKNEIRQKILNNEFNHRVKNILALIQSIVAHPREPGLEIAAYIRTLKGRIQALSLAHDQVRSANSGGGLEQLLRTELSPYWGLSHAIRLNGPNLTLEGRAFSVMALVIHEIATNAAKYGALSAPAGVVAVDWRLTDDGDCALVWTELGGPVVTPPKRRGFGSVLLERSIPFDLGGQVKIDYAPSGFCARFVVPGKFVQAMKEDTTLEPSTMSVESSKSPRFLQNKRILLVEDHLIIALEAENLLSELGVAEVVTASSVDEALKILQRQDFDVAVLDFNLGSDSSVPIAEQLVSRKTPFVFATGYTDGGAIPAALEAVPIVPKPYNTQSLVQGLDVAMSGRCDKASVGEKS